MTQDNKSISRYVGGDLSVVNELKARTSQELTSMLTNEEMQLQVTREALSSLVERYQGKELPSTSIQEWASFVRRGYFESRVNVPVKPIPIVYEPRFEQLIADVVARLDELGDEIDGVIGEEELAKIATSLKNPA